MTCVLGYGTIEHDQMKIAFSTTPEIHIAGLPWYKFIAIMGDFISFRTKIGYQLFSCEVSKERFKSSLNEIIKILRTFNKIIPMGMNLKSLITFNLFMKSSVGEKVTLMNLLGTYINVLKTENNIPIKNIKGLWKGEDPNVALNLDWYNLLKDNGDHFNNCGVETMNRIFETLEDDEDTVSRLIKLCYVLHIYTDQYSSGHIRVPRVALRTYCFKRNPKALIDRSSVLMHDEDSWNGFHVNYRLKRKPKSWFALGDKAFNQKENSQNVGYMMKNMNDLAKYVISNDLDKAKMIAFNIPIWNKDYRDPCPKFVLTCQGRKKNSINGDCNYGENELFIRDGLEQKKGSFKETEKNFYLRTELGFYCSYLRLMDCPDGTREFRPDIEWRNTNFKPRNWVCTSIYKQSTGDCGLKGPFFR
jgi:hypothetical protein